MKWNQFVLGDCYEVMKEIDDKSVDLVFTSPPDISQTQYNTDIKNYQVFQRIATTSFSRIVKNEGFVLIAQTDRKINGEILTNHITYYQSMVELGWKLKDYKIIVRNYPVDKRDMYTFNYQHCLIFTKKGTIKRSGDFLKNIMVYDTQKMKGFSGPLQLHMWNENFIELMLEYLTKENDKVIDPFAGSGVVPYVAKRMNRQYLGCEINKEVYDASIMNTAIV
jgi:DNA modification methylase